MPLECWSAYYSLMRSTGSQSSVHHDQNVSMQSAASEVQGRNLVVCIDGTSNKFGLSVCVILISLLAPKDLLKTATEYQRR